MIFVFSLFYALFLAISASHYNTITAWLSVFGVVFLGIIIQLFTYTRTFSRWVNFIAKVCSAE